MPGDVEVSVIPKYYVYKRYSVKLISKMDFMDFVDSLIGKDPRRVVGVKSKGSKFVFDTLDSASELRLDYDVTILPPKKFFLPPVEALFKYELSNGFSTEMVDEHEPVIIIGIHPYDLIAIEQVDIVFKDSHPDNHYLQKRKGSVLVGVNMQNISPNSFASSMGTATTSHGFDLMLTDLGDRYLVEIGSEKGEDLLEKCSKVAEADEEALTEAKNVKEKVLSKFTSHLTFSYKELADILEENYDNEIWNKNSENCLSCGSCNLVCPTCYCFDVQDKPDLNLKEARRVRTWDGCMLEDFAKVAGDENFRDKVARYRHRFYRKGKYFLDRFGFIACVGCGRCSSGCLPDITDPVKLYNTLKKEGS